MNPALILLVLASPCLGHVSQLSQSKYMEPTSFMPPPPPRAYDFEYTAGRFPGHVNRAQKQYGDGAGYGSYPPSFSNYQDYHQQPEDTEAVRLANKRHHYLFERIANYNSYPPMDTPRVAWEKDRHHYLYRKIAAEHAAIGDERSRQLYNRPEQRQERYDYSCYY